MNDIQRYYDEDLNKTLLIVPEDTHTVKSNELIESQREYFERQEAIKNDNRHYVNCYHDPVEELNEKLEVNELGAIMKLLPYLRINSGGRLISDGKRMGIAEIRKAIGKGDRWTVSLVKTLVEQDVLISEKEGRRNVYNVNERYHTIGHTFKDSYYTKLYQTKTRTDIKDISIQAAGVLYKMLPFFHYSKYYLCENPNERNTDQLIHLTQRKFADVVCVDKAIVNRAITELSKNGFVMISRSFGATVIMVNPDVMFRQRIGNEYTESVRYQFKQASICAEQNGVDVNLSDLPF
jgi:hypothetical protein